MNDTFLNSSIGKRYPDFQSLATALDNAKSGGIFIESFNHKKTLDVVKCIFNLIVCYSSFAPSDESISKIIKRARVLFGNDFGNVDHVCGLAEITAYCNYFSMLDFSVIKTPELIQNYFFKGNCAIQYSHFLTRYRGTTHVICPNQATRRECFLTLEILKTEMVFFESFIKYFSIFDGFIGKLDFIAKQKMLWANQDREYILYDMTGTSESEWNKLSPLHWITRVGELKGDFMRVDVKKIPSPNEVNLIKSLLKDEKIINYFKGMEEIIQMHSVIKDQKKRDPVKELIIPFKNAVARLNKFKSMASIIAPFSMHILKLINLEECIYDNAFYYDISEKKNFRDRLIQVVELITPHQKKLFNYVHDLMIKLDSKYKDVYPKIKIEKRNLSENPLAKKKVKHKKKKASKEIQSELKEPFKQAVKSVAKKVETLKVAVKTVKTSAPLKGIPMNQFMNSAFANQQKQSVLAHVNMPLVTGLPGEPFFFKKAKRVRNWDELSFGSAIPFKEYQHLPLEQQVLQHLFHAPHPFVDRFLHFGLSSDYRKEDFVERVIEVLVEMEFQGKVYKGAVKYGFGKEDDTCYHRYFTPQLSEEHQIIFSKKSVNSIESGKQVFIESYNTWITENDSMVLIEDKARQVRIKVLK